MLLVRKKNMSLSTITTQRVQELFFFFQNDFWQLNRPHGPAMIADLLTPWPNHDHPHGRPYGRPYGRPHYWPNLWCRGSFALLRCFEFLLQTSSSQFLCPPLAQINVLKFDIFTAEIHELHFNVYFGINLSCDPINLMKVYTHNNQLKSWDKGQKQEINWDWWWAPGHMPPWTPAEKSSQYLQALSSLL